jgi:hypothetical protein
MLQKIRGVRQDDAFLERQRFQDDFFDLFVWSDQTGTVVAFQLCYDRFKRERILAWREATGFIHRRIDDGEQMPVKNMSPIMISDGVFASASVAAEFDSRGLELESRLLNFIRRKIDEAAAQLPRMNESQET